MPVEIVVALITAVQAVTVAVLVPLLVSTRRHAKQANEQVTNSHDMNLRDDLDLKHRGNTSRIGRLENRVGRVEHGIDRIQDHLGIERTTPKRKAPPS